MTMRLISPNRRRIVDPRTTDVATITQLRTLGWVEYAGTCDTTTGHTRTTSGWIIPGTDPQVDKARFALTGTRLLGGKEPVKP